MSEREPAVLRDEPAGETGGKVSNPAAPAAAAAPARPAQPVLQRPTNRREAPSVYVVGFWKRFAAAAIDFFVILPVAAFITFLVSKIANVHLPAKNIKLLDIDMWIDLALAGSSALVMALVLFLAIALTYLLVFHITLGRTLGMRVLKMKVIDVYGDPPSPARCVARCAGYLAGFATLFLGFLWIGFDNEKRGLQDWIAGTYVIRV
jgi:uncharacterized RDD family membrane protein YckC